MKHRWGKAASVIGLGTIIGITVFYGISQMFEIGSLYWIIGILLFISISDIIFAWDNERAIKSGKVKLWNDIVGTTVIASETFVLEGKKYKGRVALGVETWFATSVTKLDKGEKAKISNREGLVLHIESCSYGDRDAHR